MIFLVEAVCVSSALEPPDGRSPVHFKLRWSYFIGQFGSDVKVYSGC